MFLNYALSEYTILHIGYSEISWPCFWFWVNFPNRCADAVDYSYLHTSYLLSITSRLLMQSLLLVSNAFSPVLHVVQVLLLRRIVEGSSLVDLSTLPDSFLAWFNIIRGFWFQRHVVDFYISDLQSGLRALVKAGFGARLTPHVMESSVLDVNTKSKDLPTEFLHWLSDRNLCTGERPMRLKEGYVFSTCVLHSECVHHIV